MGNENTNSFRRTILDKISTKQVLWGLVSVVIFLGLIVGRGYAEKIKALEYRQRCVEKVLVDIHGDLKEIKADVRWLRNKKK